MYKVNDLAKLFGISTQTLRYYESIHLLVPAMRDKQSGYRLYSEAELDRLSTIIQLELLGFSLNEIKAYLNHELTIDDKRKKLEQKIAIAQYQLSLLQPVLTSSSNFSITFKQRPELYALHKSWSYTSPLEIMDFYNDCVHFCKRKHVNRMIPLTFMTQLSEKTGIIDAYLALDTYIPNETVVLPTISIASVLFEDRSNMKQSALSYLQTELREHNYNTKGAAWECYHGPYNPVRKSCAAELQYELIPKFRNCI